MRSFHAPEDINCQISPGNLELELRRDVKSAKKQSQQINQKVWTVKFKPLGSIAILHKNPIPETHNVPLKVLSDF